MNLSDIIRKLRNEKKWTQARLAEESGVDDSTVGKWEYGIRCNISFECLVKLADAFDVSIDVFRPDATRFDIPRPHFEKTDDAEEELSYGGVPLRWESKKPDEQQKKILDFCDTYLATLDDKFFEKGAAQNSVYGTGRYFWDRSLADDTVMWIGYTPLPTMSSPIEVAPYRFSIAVNTGIPLDEKLLSGIDHFQVTEAKGDNWVYVPIKAIIQKENDLYPKELREAADTALFAAMKVARIALEDSMQKFIMLKATETHTKQSVFAQ